MSWLLLFLFLTGCQALNGRIFSGGGLQTVEWSAEEKAKEVSIRNLGENAHASFHLVRLSGAEKPHVHDFHDGTVFLLKGKARVYFEEKVIEMKPGDLLQIPKGRMHWARNLTPDATEAYVVFTPPFDGKDYRLIDPSWDVLSEAEKVCLRQILSRWETWVPQKQKEGTAPLMTFEELTRDLGAEEKIFLDRVQAIDPKKSFGFQGDYLGTSREGVLMKRLEEQWIEKAGERKKLDPQYLPEKVYEAYDKMMQAMEKDLGKRLLVESGYRSPAYQLYTFLSFLPKHGHSLVETGHWIAIPGYSEHGAPHRQAVDFINPMGVNGEDDVKEFERLPEYEWLTRRAHEFGFELSYPRGKKGITFEPWHWRYVQA